MPLAEYVRDTISLKMLDNDPGMILATLFQNYHEEKQERPKSHFEYGKSVIKTIFSGDDLGAGLKCAKFYADSLMEEKGAPTGRHLFDPVNQFFSKTPFNQARDSFVRVLRGFCIFHPNESLLLNDNIRSRLNVAPWQPFDNETLTAWVHELIQGLSQNSVMSVAIAGGNNREKRENSAHMLGMLRPFLRAPLSQNVFDALKARTVSGWTGKKDSQPAVREAAMTALVTLSPVFTEEQRNELPDIFFAAMRSSKIANREAAGRVFVQYIDLWPEGQDDVLEKMTLLFHQEKKTEPRCAAIDVMADICRGTNNRLLKMQAYDQIQNGLWEENNPTLCCHTAKVLQNKLLDDIPGTEKELVARKLFGRMYSPDISIQIMATSAFAHMPGYFKELPSEMLIKSLDLFLSRIFDSIADECKEEENHSAMSEDYSLTRLLNINVDRNLQYVTVEALKNLANILYAPSTSDQQRKWILGLLAGCRHIKAGLKHLAPKALLSCPGLLKINDPDLRIELQTQILGIMTAIISCGVPQDATTAADVIGHVFVEADHALQKDLLEELTALRKTGRNPEARKAATLALMSIFPAVKDTFPGILNEIIHTLTNDQVVVQEAALDAMPALLAVCSGECWTMNLITSLANIMNADATPQQIKAQIAVCFLGSLDKRVIALVPAQETMDILTNILDSKLNYQTRLEILKRIKTLRHLPDNNDSKTRLFKAFVAQLDINEVRSAVADGIKAWLTAGEEGIFAAVFTYLSKKLCIQTTPGERVLFADILSTFLEDANDHQINQYFFRLFDKVARFWLDIQHTDSVAGTGLEVIGLACAKNASRLMAGKVLVPEESAEQNRQPAAQRV